MRRPKCRKGMYIRSKSCRKQKVRGQRNDAAPDSIMPQMPVAPPSLKVDLDPSAPAGTHLLLLHYLAIDDGSSQNRSNPVAANSLA